MNNAQEPFEDSLAAIDELGGPKHFNHYPWGSDVEVEPGRHELRYEFEPHGKPDLAQGHGMPGRFQLYIDGKLAGDMDVAHTTPFAFNPGALTCGADPGSAVSDAYKAPNRFTGTIHTVTVDLSGELITDPEAELKLHMARQ